VNRSCLFFRALSRTPCNPWYTRSPLCVSKVLDSTVFSLVTGLPSTHLRGRCLHRLCSAASQVLIPVFDSSMACMPGLCSWLPGPTRLPGRPRMPARSLGSRACSFSTCVRLLGYAGPDGHSPLRFRQCGLPDRSTRSAPRIPFSKLDSSPAVPLSTLHPAPHGTWPKTPGQDGWLLLSCGARRFIPALALPLVTAR
jgi:hypothetical protein